MVVGKNKRLTKGKKGQKKKIVDPFTRKDWYDVKAPSMFLKRQIGKTVVNRTSGTKIASDALKGRVFEVSLADLQDDEVTYRKFRLMVEDVQGKQCLTNFHGLDMTTDKLRSLVKKWQPFAKMCGSCLVSGLIIESALKNCGLTDKTKQRIRHQIITNLHNIRRDQLDVQGQKAIKDLQNDDEAIILSADKGRMTTLIEGNVDVKTTDGYLLRLFCIGFTKRRGNQIKKTSYAKHSQIKLIRKKMVDIMTQEVGTNDLKEVVNKLIPDSIGRDIEKACQSIYPLHDVFIRKVKVLKKPKFDVGKLMEMHGDSGSTTVTTDETGAKIERDSSEPPVLESV